MEYKILFTQQANKDLDCIKEYIYPCNEAAASYVVKKKKKNIDMLRKMPSIGRAGRVLRTRELIIHNYPYIVPYQVRDDVVFILRVMHTSRKWG